MCILVLLAPLALGAPATSPSPSPSPSPAAGTPAEPAPESPVAPSEPPPPEAEAPPPEAEPAPKSEAAPKSEEPATETATATAAPPTDAPQPAPPEASKAKGQFTFFWDMSQTVGSSFRFVDDYSVRGLSAAFEYRVLPILGVGVLAGYTYTDDVVRYTRILENSALTATELRTIQATPIMATIAAHIPTGKGGIRGRGWAEPFVGLGIGTYYSLRGADSGWFWDEDDGWHFGLMPFLGVQIDTPGPQVILGSRFNWAAKTDKSAQELFLTFNIGLGFFAF